MANPLQNPRFSRGARWAALAFVPLLAWVGTPKVGAQPSFVDITPTSDPYFVTPADEDFWVNALAPADIDQDGDLDLAAIGYYVVYNVSAEDRLVLFLNQGADGQGHWLFTEVLVPLGDLSSGASDLAWGDYDRDGDEDLAVGSNGATVIFRNDAGNLTALANLLPGYAEDSTYNGAYDLRSLAWADFDNDADLDLLIPSVWNAETTTYSSVLLRNDGSDGQGGWSFVDAQAGIDPAVHAQSTWADDDGDGDLDLLLLNVDNYTETSFLRRFANQAGVFQGSPLTEANELSGLVDWADADGDGDFDLLVVGNLLEADQTYNTVLRVLRNDAGVYVPLTLEDAPNVDWLDLHAATWADYDSDGDVDILATGSYVGESEIVGHSKIYANDNNSWAPLPLELPAPISSVGQGGTFTWLDLDADGDLDYLVAGAHYVPNGNGLVESKLTLFRNDAAATNLPPGPPTQTQALPLEGGIRLQWQAAIDDHTPAASLTYELELRLHGAPAPTAQRPPEPGKISQATTWSLQGLAPGVYDYRLCAIDSALNPGLPIEGSFTVPLATTIFADGFESGATTQWSASH